MRQSLLFLFPGIPASAFALATIVFVQPPSSSEEHRSTVKPNVVHFEDIAQQVGLTALNSYGGDKHKEFIIESTGNGAIVFDYDNDGWPDIYFPNGSPAERLYHSHDDTRLTYNNKPNGTAFN